MILRSASRSFIRNWQSHHAPSATVPKVRSFHAWSLLDVGQAVALAVIVGPFEIVDHRDQKRTVKDSGLWYGDVSAPNRLYSPYRLPASAAPPLIDLRAYT